MEMLKWTLEFSSSPFPKATCSEWNIQEEIFGNKQSANWRAEDQEQLAKALG